MNFIRGHYGQRAYARFLTRPLVWVEGPEDVESLAPLAVRFGFELRPAGGRPEAEKLAEALVQGNLSYTVVLDGDYGVLTRSRSSHRRRIVLRRYAMENYLAEEHALTILCLGLARCQKLDDLWSDGFAEMQKEMEQALKELVIFDIAQQRAELGIAVLPRSIEALLENGKAFKLSKVVVSKIADRVGPLVPPEKIKEASELLENFLGQHRFIDVVPSHLLFSAIRWLVLATIQRHGQKAQLDYKMLRAALAANVWRRTTSAEHRRFLDRLRSAIAETRVMRSAERSA